MVNTGLSGRNRTIWFDDGTWEAAEARADQEGHNNASMVVREATRAYCGIPKPDVARTLPKRFLDAVKIFPLLEKMAGSGKTQTFELSFENHLTGLYPAFGRAHHGVALLCTMLKKAAKVQVLMEDLITAQKIDGIKNPQKRKEGFILSFEYPVSAKTLSGYRADVIKALQETDMMEIIIQSEISGKAPPTDESKELKAKVGVDDLKALAEHNAKPRVISEKDEDEK